MDRNDKIHIITEIPKVALRKESVDRNQKLMQKLLSDTDVALRKESVDRNSHQIPKLAEQIWVALRKESVDRNPVGVEQNLCQLVSLSARRAWIEMYGD